MEKRNSDKPHLINFQQTGTDSSGFISITEFKNDIPFNVKRVFWIYKTPKKIVRGNHANITNKEVLIAIQGEIRVTTLNSLGEKTVFILNDPNVGVFIPANIWLTLEYSENTIQLVLASEEYEENNYIRNYQEFTS
jgi:hypothetical protein